MHNRAVPLTVVAATAYAVTKVKATSSAVQTHPLKFVPSGEPKFDSANMDRIRAEWRHRNNGIGLKDVRYVSINRCHNDNLLIKIIYRSRSGGGV
jgi:hypothetical protein